MPKVERKIILSRQPLALHEVEKTGWKHQRIETFGVFDIPDALKLILRRILLADPGLLSKMECQDDKEFTESSHRTRRYISKDLEVVYLQKDEAVAKKHSVELYGYWFPTNIGFKELSAIFHLACLVAKLEGHVRHNLKDVVSI